MPYSGTLVEISVRPASFAAGFHHLFTTPVVEIDGAPQPTRWGTTRLALDPGPHRLAVYFHYRGRARSRLAETSQEVEITRTSDTLVFAARLGPLNGSRFTLTGPTAD